MTGQDKLEMEEVSRAYLTRREEALQNRPSDPASMEFMKSQGYLEDHALQCMRLKEYKEAMMLPVEIDEQPQRSNLSANLSAVPSPNDRPCGPAHLTLSKMQHMPLSSTSAKPTSTSASNTPSCAESSAYDDGEIRCVEIAGRRRYIDLMNQRDLEAIANARGS
jgi:hypothetical protein